MLTKGVEQNSAATSLQNSKTFLIAPAASERKAILIGIALFALLEKQKVYKRKK